MQAVLQDTGGGLKYKHDNGELSQVRIELAGMGLEKMRRANFTPDVPDRTARDTLDNNGEVKAITE
jgi:hypothetical protein